MKLDEKKLLDILYTILGIFFYYFKIICFRFGIVLKGINKSQHITTKNNIKLGLNYKRKPNYFDVDLSSSGTTGEPTTVYANPLHWISEQSAQMEYFSNNGYSFRDKMIIVRGFAPAPGEHFIKRDKLRNFVWISPFHLNKKNIHIIKEELSGKYFLRGYPSSLELLSKLLQNHSINYPVACFTASETLSNSQRKAIETIFSCKVYDWYGTSEPAVLLFQDKLSYPYYKTPLFHCKTRFIETSSKDVKVLGCAIWDSLSNLGYYDTGDLVILEDKQVVEIKGRSSDFLILNDLNIPVTNFLTVFYSCSGILRFQIINFKDLILFIIDVDDDGTFIHDNLNVALKHRLGSVDYLIDESKKFIQSKYGKTPHFINFREISYYDHFAINKI